MTCQGNTGGGGFVRAAAVVDNRLRCHRKKPADFFSIASCENHPPAPTRACLLLESAINHHLLRLHHRRHNCASVGQMPRNVWDTREMLRDTRRTHATVCHRDAPQCIPQSCIVVVDGWRLWRWFAWMARLLRPPPQVRRCPSCVSAIDPDTTTRAAERKGGRMSNEANHSFGRQ